MSVVHIARCAEHGLHGARKECFVCGADVEQVPMVALEARERSDEAISEMYWAVKRKPKEGTINDAIETHAQACGLVAYVFDVHPDQVAHVVSQAHLRGLLRESHVETYKPKPRPAGEARAKIRAAVFQPPARG